MNNNVNREFQFCLDGNDIGMEILNLYSTNGFKRLLGPVNSSISNTSQWSLHCLSVSCDSFPFQSICSHLDIQMNQLDCYNVLDCWFINGWQRHCSFNWTDTWTYIPRLKTTDQERQFGCMTVVIIRCLIIVTLWVWRQVASHWFSIYDFDFDNWQMMILFPMTPSLNHVHPDEQSK
jgi:hypothetical protein